MDSASQGARSSFIRSLLSCPRSGQFLVTFDSTKRENFAIERLRALGRASGLNQRNSLIRGTHIPICGNFIRPAVFWPQLQVESYRKLNRWLNSRIGAT
jgi:hypothetical protein